MMRVALVVALIGCHAAPTTPTTPAPPTTPPQPTTLTLTTPAIDPPPPRGVMLPRDVMLLGAEAELAPAKQRWAARFKPRRDVTIGQVLTGYRADLAAAHIEVTNFEWLPDALDYSVGTDDSRLDVFVRPNDDGTYSIAVDAPGVGHDL